MSQLPLKMLIRRYINEDSLLYALINLHNNFELTLSLEKCALSSNIFYKRPLWKPQSLIKTTCVRYGKERKEYLIDFMYTGFVATIAGEDVEIWEVNNPYRVMPTEFIFLSKYVIYQYIILQDEEASYEAEIPILVPPPRGLNSVQKKLAAFCESNKDSYCPITMEPFTCETICLTPCGHGVKHSAMLEWLATSQQCPMCRAACRTDQLIKW